MPSPAELNQLRVSLEELDQLLIGLADFRRFPDLLTHEDPQVQSLVERTVISVRDARVLAAGMLAAMTAIDGAEPRAGEFSPSHPASENSLDANLPGPETAETEPVTLVSPPAHLEQITMANPTGMRELVLIADHDAVGLAEMEQMLTDEDYRVLSVRDGFEAISIYARLWAAIDLVILDFSLPGISGDLVFDELQAINPKVAAVVSSGFTHPEKLKQMLAQGLSGFLPKPYERERLIRQIQQVLAHRPGMIH